MSSILKALRKVEDEKATLGEGNVNLAHDILKRNYDNRKTVPWVLLSLLAFFMLVTAGLAIWWLLPSPASHKQESTPSAAPAPVVKNSPVRKATSIVEPIAEPIVLPVKPAEIEKVNPEKVVKIPDLVIDEIVYHQSPASRLAVINDLPVMEGTDIGDVRIEEIRPDSVRFSYRGIYFDKSRKSP